MATARIQEMKLLQIGTGRWGLNHLRVLSNLRIDLYVAEITESGRAKCLEHGIAADHISADYRDFRDRVDAVDIVTPASTHFPLCREFLAQGKDIFIEKPLAPTAAEADELARLASQRQVVVQVGHVFRYDPAADFIREYLQSGQLGAVKSISGNFSGFKRPRTDGGVTISDAIHFIDFFNYLMGRGPAKVLARCEDLLKRGMDDMSWIWMDYDGIPAVLEANYFAPEKKRLIVIGGERATLVCDFASAQDKIKIYGNRHILDNDTWKTTRGEIIHKEILPVEPLLRELRDFLNCVATRAKPRADARNGADAVKVVEAALRSHAEGRQIVL
jgi:UDP-N-acetylglucosamine 3-dehydrogenase